MKIDFKELIDEHILWDCLIWYFDIDETKNQITIIFENPHYRLAAHYEGEKVMPPRDFRMVLFRNVKHLKKNFKKLRDRSGTYENFLFWVKDKPVEIEHAEILKKDKKNKSNENEKNHLKIYFSEYGEIQFACDKTTLHLKRSFKAIHKIDGDQMYLVNETGDIVSLRDLVQTNEFCEIFFR